MDQELGAVREQAAGGRQLGGEQVKAFMRPEPTRVESSNHHVQEGALHAHH